MDARIHRALSASDSELRAALLAAIRVLVDALNEHGMQMSVEALADRVTRLANLLADIDNDATRRGREHGPVNT